MISFIKKHYLLFFLIFLGIMVRFIDIAWGAPFYFHPDERNIASSVSQLIFPTQMNPNFFAYGSLPMYIFFFTGILVQGFSTNHVSFEQTIIISRFYSALLSVLLIPLLFFIGQKIKDQTTGIIVAVLATFSVGFIQFAHFGTFEIWLTFFTVLLFYICILLSQKPSLKNMLLCSVVMGILISIKISSILLVPLPLFVFFLSIVTKKQKIEYVEKFFIFLIIFFLISTALFFITNPFSFFDHSSFLGSFKYESAVALGTEQVFYTNEFTRASPIIFQFLFIYPFLINPINTALFILCFFFICFLAIKKKSFLLLLLILFFGDTFFSQAFLYVKWTRYIVPTLPFIYLFIAVAFSYFLERKQLFQKKIFLSVFFISIVSSVLFGMAYTFTVYMNPDTRMTAAALFAKGTPNNTPIISEIYDLGIVPFNPFFNNIKLFDFYNLSSSSAFDLATKLEATNYIILPSQRILKTRVLHPQNYPYGNLFYSKLFDGTLGFTKIYETPCDFLCNMVYLGSPVFSFEETASVFDRPDVFIFKKQENLSSEQYLKMLTP